MLRYAYNVRLGAGLCMYFYVALRARACAIRPRCTYPVSQRRAMRRPELTALEQIAELGFVSHASHIYMIYIYM